LSTLPGGVVLSPPGFLFNPLNRMRFGDDRQISPILNKPFAPQINIKKLDIVESLLDIIISWTVKVFLENTTLHNINFGNSIDHVGRKHTKNKF